MKVLTLLGSAAPRSSLSSDYLRREGIDRFEYPVLILLSTLGMMMMISAERPDRALSRPRAAEPGALRRRRLPPRQSALDRSGPEVLRPRRAVLGMLLYGASLVYGFTGTVSFPGIATALARRDAGIGLIFGLVFVAGRPRLQDLGRAVPHVDARRLRGRADAGDGLLRLGARRWPRMAHDGARLHRRLPRHPRPVAADHRLHLDRLDGARLLRRHRPAQHQAADGLFLDRQCRLRADRARGRHAGGRPGRRRSTWRSISP